MAVIDFHPRNIARALTAELAVVVPVYNEAANIAAVLGEWRACLRSLAADFQFILVNDGSKDGTLPVLRELEQQWPAEVVVVNKSNSGHGRSVRLGYDAAVAADSVRWILQIDSDGQCDPLYFKEFWAARADADCVFGVRRQRDDGFARKVTSQICRLGSSLLCGMDLTDPNVPYRLMKKEPLSLALAKIPASFDIHNVALTFTLKKNPALQWRYVPIRFRQRQGGDNSINLFQVTHWGVNMLIELRRLPR